MLRPRRSRNPLEAAMTIRMSQTQRDRLQRAADRLGVSKGDIIRYLIDMYLDDMLDRMVGDQDDGNERSGD